MPLTVNLQSLLSSLVFPSPTPFVTGKLLPVNEPCSREPVTHPDAVVVQDRAVRQRMVELQDGMPVQHEHARVLAVNRC